jgi:hypothetical protein
MRERGYGPLIRRGGKTIGVFADRRILPRQQLGAARLLQMPWKKRQMAIISALLPVEQIVEKLNDFQPLCWRISFPIWSCLLRTAERPLKIHPAFIMTAESIFRRAPLRLRMHCCYVQTSYACTEGAPSPANAPAALSHQRRLGYR